MMNAKRIYVSVVGLMLGHLLGCRETAAPAGPELVCVEACKKGMDHCNENGCGRGCNLVLDRLVERERSRVFACVDAAKSCADSTWAMCATRVGNYVDGGPGPEDFSPDAGPSVEP